MNVLVWFRSLVWLGENQKIGGTGSFVLGIGQFPPFWPIRAWKPYYLYILELVELGELERGTSGIWPILAFASLVFPPHRNTLLL